MKRAIPQAVVSALGVWLMFAPAVLGYVGTAAATNHRLIGPTIAAVGFVATSEITRSLRWVNVACAVWLLVSPWVLESSTAATITSVVVAVAVGLLAPLGKPNPARFGGGWSSLWRPERLADADPDAVRRS